MRASAADRGAVDVRVPGDKSMTHRALLVGALASGTTIIRRPLISADTHASAAALRALGCTVSEPGDECMVQGVGLHGLRAPHDAIDCGNSGTTARLLMGVLAGHPFAATLTGDESLRGRPMRRIIDPLSRMGAAFTELERPDRLPVRMQGGALRPLDYRSPHASAQVKSAILLAGLTGSADVRITEPVLSRDHTERLLEELGVPLLRESHADGTVSVALRPIAALPAFDLTVPGDISSAAFAAAFACLASQRSRPVRILDVGLNPTRTGFLDVLRRMGASIDVENARESCGEPLGDVVVHSSRLHGTHIAPAEVPSLIDELPMIAVIAARAEGSTTVEGAAELRVKETDRIRAVVDNLTAIGARAEERADGFVVHGSSGAVRGRVRAHGDHRIAMAFAVLAAAQRHDIEIDEPAVVGVSFPGFWSLLHSLRDASPT